MKKQKLILSVMSLLFLSTLSFNNTTSAIVNSSNNDVQATKTTTQDAYLVKVVDTSGSSTPTVGNSKLVATTTSSLNSYGGLTKGQTYVSDTFLVGIIGHTYKTTIKTITKVKGVYSHLTFISRELLLTGSSLTKLDEYEYSAAASETLYFYESFRGQLEASLDLAFNASGNGGSVSAGASVNTAYTYQSIKTEYYTRKKVTTSQYTMITSLNSSSAQYCPEGYAITIGQHGTYYEVTANVKLYQNWWWESNYLYEDFDISFIIADVTNFTTDYVYKKDTDSSSTLYYLN